MVFSGHSGVPARPTLQASTSPAPPKEPGGSPPGSRAADPHGPHRPQQPLVATPLVAPRWRCRTSTQEAKGGNFSVQDPAFQSFPEELGEGLSRVPATDVR